MFHDFSVLICHRCRLGGEKHSSHTFSSFSSVPNGKTLKISNSKMQKITQMQCCKHFASHSLQVMGLYFSLLLSISSVYCPSSPSLLLLFTKMILIIKLIISNMNSLHSISQVCVIV